MGLRVEPAQLGDGLGGALGGHRQGLVAIERPDMGDRQQIRPQAKAVDQRARPLPRAISGKELVKGPLHGVHGMAGAGQQARMGEALKGLRHGLPAGRQPQDLPIGEPELHDGHAVFGEGAGLVGAEDRGRAQGLDGGGPAGQHPRLADAPGPHGHEDRQHHRQFGGQHGHADGDARQRRLQPVAPRITIEQHGHHAEADPHHGEDQHHAPRLRLQARRLALKLAQ